MNIQQLKQRISKEIKEINKIQMSQDNERYIELQAQLSLLDEVEEIFFQFKKEFFDKFDEYACIKNDKWYLDFKQQSLLNKSEVEK